MIDETDLVHIELSQVVILTPFNRTLIHGVEKASLVLTLVDRRIHSCFFVVILVRREFLRRSFLRLEIHNNVLASNAHRLVERANSAEVLIFILFSRIKELIGLHH